MTTLGTALDPRRNSVNAIRLFFAVSILFLHALPLGGYMKEMPKFFFHDTIGTYMLAGFFVISGYMITASRLASRSLRDYFWRRVLRIYPAWILSLSLVAFVFGPLSRMIDGKSGYDWSSGVSFIYSNFFFVLHQLSVDGTLTKVPVPGVWNFSAWTLFYEFSLWIGMGLLVTLAPGRLLKPGSYLGLAVFTALEIYSKLTTNEVDRFATAHTLGHTSTGPVWLGLLEPLARLGIFFMAGSILYLNRDKVKMSAAFAWFCAAVSFVLAIVGWFHVLAALPWAYVILYLGCSKRFARINYPDDYSYGMYIYAYPVTQIVATISLRHSMPGWLFLLLCLIGTAPIAWASWHLLEKPAMTLKRLTKGRDKPIVGVP